MKRTEIQIRDPFVVADSKEHRYLLFGTTDPEPWRSAGVGFDVYESNDLREWSGPRAAFRPPAGFWATTNYWAPEAHHYRDSWYLFASFKSDSRSRGTQIFRSRQAAGPYGAHSDGPVTPADWECLDGTLFVDERDVPWMVFCHEWVQVADGQVCAMKLSEDLSAAAGAPAILFRASEASWTRPHRRRDGSIDPTSRVTDGPFLHRMKSGTLLMLWSSFSDRGYAMGMSWSESGEISGPWRHHAEPLIDGDGGHGMLFRAFDGSLYVTCHSPNRTPDERPLFVPVLEQGNRLIIDRGTT